MGCEESAPRPEPARDVPVVSENGEWIGLGSRLINPHSLETVQLMSDDSFVLILASRNEHYRTASLTPAQRKTFIDSLTKARKGSHGSIADKSELK